MLRALNRPDDDRAYQLPWRIDREDPAHPCITNTGAASVDFVRAFHRDTRGEPHTEHWGLMLPGDTAELCLCDADLDRVIATLAWFRAADGREYLWRFVP